MSKGPESSGLKRRDFLKVLGAAGAATAASGCGRDTTRLIPYINSPDDTVPGVSTYFATTCHECSVGCGVLAEVREGRVIRVEGNPAHPLSQGKICSRGLAQVQGLYDPDRWEGPHVRRGADFVPITWDEAITLLRQKLDELRTAGTASRAIFINRGESGAFTTFLDEWLAIHGMPRHVPYDPMFEASVVQAHREVYGVDWPALAFDKARLVVSFGADFLDNWGAPIVQQLDYARARTNFESAPRLVYIGPRRPVTGLNADTWIPARPGTELLIARALAGEGVSLEQAAEAADVSVAALRNLAQELGAGPNMLLAGGHSSNTYELALTVARLNQRLGNVGVTILPSQPILAPQRVASFAEMWGIAELMAAGQIPMLMVRHANPAYSLPASLKFAEIMERVPFKVSFSMFKDETSIRCDLILPDTHALESWGMSQPLPNLISMQQPVMEPLLATRSTPEVLIEVARKNPLTAPAYTRNSFREWVIDRFPGGLAEFTRALMDGVWPGTLALPRTTAAPPLPAVPPRPAPTPIERTAGDVFLVVYEHPFLGDGSGANKAWLQEIPDPVTKVCWQTVVEMHPVMAVRLGIEEGDVVRVRTEWGVIEAPALLYPGVRADTVAVATGRGHSAYGRFAEGVGVNPLLALPPVAEAGSGAFVWTSTRATIEPTGEHLPIVTTEGSARQHGRGIAQALHITDVRGPGVAVLGTTGERHADEISVPGAEIKEGPGAASEVLGEGAAGHGGEHEFQGAAPSEYLPGLRAPVANDAEGEYGNPYATSMGMYDPEHWSRMATHRWAMTIDLARCTGCSACVTACYSENNIPTVGAKWQAPAFLTEQAWGANIVKGREMHWLRIERYYEGGEHMGTEFTPEFETRFVPMLCQHCGSAPCEPVCPVYATYHSPDGLNVQVYNRCVGTRYCSNNCPYKVRYFNWFGYGEQDRPQYSWPGTLALMLNPDVTVRGKGVMEKCTFCVQRIRETENRVALEGRPIRPDEFTTACASACPSNAIVFGDAADPSWEVTKLIANPRSYHVFTELNSYPAVTYLKKVNHHPAPLAPAAE